MINTRKVYAFTIRFSIAKMNYINYLILLKDGCLMAIY